MDGDALIGLAAGLLSTAAFVPQAWQIWASRRASDVSWTTYAVLVVAGLLWIVHGVRAEDPALVATNAVIVLVSCAIIAMKRRFGRLSA